jgi:hypothetical protein
MALTAARLASLNHGSIVSPLPGGEASVVLSKVRTWARDVPEIHLEGDDRNPTIRVQLSDVDYESIVERAKSEDNEGRRRELLKDLVSEGLGVALGNQDLQGAYAHDVIWRGSRRRVDVLFGNVRDRTWLSDDHFRAAPETWRVVVDHPFDDPGHSTAEDLERLDEMVARGVHDRTLVWLPHFLSDEKLRELRRLVILNWLLDGSAERWQGHADHLNETDRALARSILESQRNTLRRSLEDAVQQAYGAASRRPGVLREDASHDRTLFSFERLFAPVNPVGATLGQAFENLLGQAFGAVFPAHPTFEPGDVEVKLRDLKVVAGYIARTVADSEKRVELQADAAVVRRIAEKLGVGKATEMHYLLGDDRFTPWGQEIERALGRRAQEGGPPPDGRVSVRELRDWIRDVMPAHGLRVEVADLVIIAWAALRQRAWWQHGSPLPAVPDPGSLSPTMELRTEVLPTAEEWAAAGKVGGGMLGATANAYLTAPAVADFVNQVVIKATALAQTAPELVSTLESAYRRFGLTDGDRLRTARATAALVQQLRHLTGVKLVQVVGSADLGHATAVAAGKSLDSAAQVSRALTEFQWHRLDPLLQAMDGEGERAASAADVVNRLRDALERDEMVTSIGSALRSCDEDIFTWLNVPVDLDPVVPPPDPARSGRASRPRRGDDEVVLGELRAFLSAHSEETVDITWQVGQ